MNMLLILYFNVVSQRFDGMAGFWNITNDLDRISNEILDPLDSIHRHLVYEWLDFGT